MVPSTWKNSGYWGMNIVKGKSYSFRMAVRSVEGFNGSVEHSDCQCQKERSWHLAKLKSFDGSLEVLHV